MPYKDKRDQKACAKRHYENNKALYKSRARTHTYKARKQCKKYVFEYLSSNPCSCGESDPVVLEFHHRDPKDKRSTISAMLSNSCSMKVLTDEIEKCDVLCANCHRRLHHKLKVE